MLVELHVRNLGVIDDLVVHLGPGMTALTGETGAGKTLVVEAIELLVGGRADAALVRAGADLASVEGRFLGEDGSETVLAREIPPDGRSRAYVDGRMATAGTLSELGGRLVDLHGQHAHQSLLHTSAQRAALDAFAGIGTEAVDRAQAAVRALDARLAELGGDPQTLAREIDLLRYQLAELDGAHLVDDDEEEALAAEETILASAESLRLAASEAREALVTDEASARDQAGRAEAALGRHEPLADLRERLAAVVGELADVAAELRNREEGFADDPERLAAVQERQHVLSGLRRKYGASLEAVIAYRDECRARLDDLEAGDARRADVERERTIAVAELIAAETELGSARRAAAPTLAAEIEKGMRELALGRARFEIAIGEGRRGDDVEFRFSANAGERTLPLAKTASGGELARAMLATRLVLIETPGTLVFDEVDAGIGGEAALTVGAALARLGERHQVLVVTHLAQVAAYASEQIAISKDERDGRTLTTARPVRGEERLVELSRMLSGQPESESARAHASELLAAAASTGSGRRSDTLSERTPGRAE